jgi:hypothetical protein
MTTNAILATISKKSDHAGGFEGNISPIVGSLSRAKDALKTKRYIFVIY